MNISFEVPYPFIEFMCHAVAAALYFYGGYKTRDPDDDLQVSLIVAIILTTIGANL